MTSQRIEVPPPLWVLWWSLNQYQKDGIEWSSPAKVDQDFSIQSRKLLNNLKTKGA